MSLNHEQKERYQRQLGLPGMDEAGQMKLLESRVVVLGTGGMGAACAIHLASAGVGQLTLVDPGTVSAADLIYSSFTSAHIALSKVAALSGAIALVNADVSVKAVSASFDAHNAEELLSAHQVVIDALGNWQDKLLASDVCMQLGRPLVHGGLAPFSFQVFTMIPRRSACLRCVFARSGLEDPPERQAQGPVLGPMAGMAGALQAQEAIRLLTGILTSAERRLIRFDALRGDFDCLGKLTPCADCPDCGRRPIA